jgi:uncharacterized protein YbaA (DUF1428 family)
MNYVDGYVAQVQPGRFEEYKVMAELGAKVWMEHGALGYVEALSDDVPYGKLTSFPRAVEAPEGAQVIFAFVLYRDRAHRDEVNAKVYVDPRMNGWDYEAAPIDMKKMIFGGFVPFVKTGTVAGD